MATFGEIPPALKRIQPYLKIADDHEKKDIVITYWCRLYAVQSFLKVNAKSKESSAFLLAVMDWLEKAKKENRENEAITNEVVAQAHIENYALKLFLWADGQDRASVFNKNVVKAFYSAGLIYDVASMFGESSEEVAHHKKYAKWKATYIHNCLKNGTAPVPGPLAMENDDEFAGEGASNAPSSFQPANNDPFEMGGNMPHSQESGSSGFDAHPPYPVGGVFATGFGSSDSHAMNLIPPVPTGVHAPPSTPNGLNQPLPPSASTGFTAASSELGSVTLTATDFHKAQKYCKFAGSALQYEDIPAAVENLQKALALLTTGKDE